MIYTVSLQTPSYIDGPDLRSPKTQKKKGACTLYTSIKLKFYGNVAMNAANGWMVGWLDGWMDGWRD